MRVISGKYKGKKLIGFDIDGTRPTMDRVKESIFSMIQKDILNKTVLDLFSGSGSLGIEAISNKASMCYFVDNNKLLIDIIRKNTTNMNGVNIIKDDYIGSGSYLKVSNGINEKIYYFLVLGDINGDGSVNIIDTMMCANNVLLFNFDSSNIEHIACDVDNNKNINIVDVIKIANYILNSEDGF